MHVHERKIVKEVFSSKKTVHLLYKGARLGVIIHNILKSTKEPLVVLGCPQKFIAKLKETEKPVTEKTSKIAQQKTPLKIKEIDTKTSKKRRTALYTEGGCVFVSEHIFLCDILKENVSSENIRVLYILSERFVQPSKNIMDFILFSANGYMSILCEWSSDYSSSELIRKGEFASSGIFLYPSFRKSVTRSLGDFEITKISVPIGTGRELIQTEISELMRKIKNLPGKKAFEEYVQRIHKLLEVSLNILYNASIGKFIEYFELLTDIDHTMRALVSMSGIADSSYARNTIYKDVISWTLLPEVEVIKQMSQEMKETEKESPKETELNRIVTAKKNAVIFADKLENPFSSGLRIERASKLIRVLRKAISQSENNEIKLILLNYSVEFLRKLKLAVRRYKKREVRIEVTILQLKGSLEEFLRLEGITAEKDEFIRTIGIKQNKPESTDKKSFKKRAEDPKAPNIQIDLRELRCTLPLHLSQKFNNQFNFDFTQLIIGDYVLNNTYFIERKRIDDFISSLSSGRLFKQLQALEYSKGSSYLLIEFPENDKICFQKYRNKLQELDLTGKIVNLLLTMKNTYIFYSSIPKHSSSLIQALARKPPSEREKTKNPPEIIEALLCIPGIDYKNIDKILNNFKSMYDLITSEKEKIISILGNDLGSKTYHFFN